MKSASWPVVSASSASFAATVWHHRASKSRTSIVHTAPILRAIVGLNNTLARVLGGDPVLIPKNWEEPIRPLASAKEYEPRILGDHGDGLADSPAAKLASS